MRTAQKKGGINMEIGALASSALYQMNQGSVKVNGYDTPTDVGVAMLGKERKAQRWRKRRFLCIRSAGKDEPQYTCTVACFFTFSQTRYPALRQLS